MQNPPKQNRSKLRIQKIIETAEEILLTEGIDEITIANISELSGLKRTSTYKFFPTPNALKLEMSNIYMSECIKDFKSKTQNIKTDNLSVVVLRCVGILYDYFDNNLKAQKLILSNEFGPSIGTDKFYELSLAIQSFVDMNIKLPEMFNKDGVYRVFTQIIISIFSLNQKENDSIDEVGKIEAHRAGHAYLLDWVNQGS
jgi:AcrR family transcriptional regulator